MNFNFAQALEAMEADAAFNIANQARPPADYLLAEFLPEQNKPSYQAKNNTMIVRSIMAGMAAMDSPFPPGGFIELKTFNEETAKIANDIRMPEAALRQLQELIMRLMGQGDGVDDDFIQREALNFLDKTVVQAHLDTMEMLRGLALGKGAIDWTFNKKRLNVDYGLGSNLLPARAGNDGYGGSASKFWTDVGLLQKALKYSVRAYIVHIDTLNMIIANSVNTINVLSQTDAVFEIQRRVTQAGALVPSPDAREKITLIGYGLEGEIIDPANPNATLKIPFYPRGKMTAIGNNVTRGYQVGQGSTPAPDNVVGYTHIGPTTEGGGRMGRWSRLFVPEAEPWSLAGQGVTNGLPVIEAPEKVAIATTDMV